MYMHTYVRTYSSYVQMIIIFNNNYMHTDESIGPLYLQITYLIVILQSAARRTYICA